MGRRALGGAFITIGALMIGFALWGCGEAPEADVWRDAFGVRQTWPRYDAIGWYQGCVVDGDSADDQIQPGIGECTCWLMSGATYGTYMKCKGAMSIQWDQE